MRWALAGRWLAVIAGLVCAGALAQTPPSVRTEGDCSQAFVYVEVKGSLEINCGLHRAELQRLMEELTRYRREQRLTAAQTRQLVAIVNAGLADILLRLADISTTVRATQQTVTVIHTAVQELRSPPPPANVEGLYAFDANFHHARLLQRLREQSALRLPPGALAALDERRIASFASQLATMERSHDPAAQAELDYARGVAQVLLQSKKDALPFFQKAFEARPNEPDYVVWFAAAREDTQTLTDFERNLYRKAVALYAERARLGPAPDPLSRWRATNRLSLSLIATSQKEAVQLRSKAHADLERLARTGAAGARVTLGHSHDAMCSMYCGLNRYSEAWPHADAATAIRRELVEADLTLHGPDLADTLESVANCKQVSGDRVGALTVRSELIKVYRRLSVQTRSLRMPMGYALDKVATQQIESGNFDEGLQAYAEAETLFRQVAAEGNANARWWRAAVLHRMGSSSANIRTRDEQIRFFEAAIVEWRRLRENPDPAFDLGLAESLRQLAELNRYPAPVRAELEFREASRLLVEMGGKLPAEYRLNVASTRAAVGNTLWLQARYDESALELGAAIPMFRQLAARDPNMRFDLAATLNNLGVSDGDASRYDKALVSLQEALQIYKVLRTENSPRVSVRNIGQTLYNIAINHRNLGRHAEAESSLKEARRLMSGAMKDSPNDALVQMHVDVDEALAVLYRDYMTGRYTDAEEPLLSAAQLRRRLPRTDPAEQLALAKTLRMTGALYGWMERRQESVSYLEEALDIHRANTSRGGAGHRIELATALRELGVVRWNMGDRAKGQELQEEGLRLRRSLYRENPGAHQAALAQSLEDLAVIFDGLGAQAKVRELRAEKDRLGKSP